MLYVCVPTHNEAVTVGVLLWRLRTMLREQAGGRDYEVVVYDDASTDATPDVLAPYARVLPLTILRGERWVGQSAAVDALVQYVVSRSRSPETDAAVLMQADYTDVPELLPELLGLFDAGADLVLTRRPLADEQPLRERRLRRAAQALLPPFVRPAVRDTTARDPAALLSFLRLYRVAVLRDAVRTAGGTPLISAPGWAGTAELVVRTAPFAQRIERVDAPARYDVRTRPSRIDWLRELRAVAAMLWQNRGAGRTRSGGAQAVGTETGRVSGRMDRSHLDAAHAASPLAGIGPRDTSREDITSVGVPVEVPSVGAPPLGAPPLGVPSVRDGDVLAPTDDATDAAGAPTSTPRRRRRGRGRPGASPSTTDAVPAASDEGAREPRESAPSLTLLAPTPSDAVTANTRDASDRDLSENESRDETSNDLADASVDGAPGATAKRRRRRGGARRRSRGPEPDTGVPPSDADSATWQGAPSDQPPS